MRYQYQMGGMFADIIEGVLTGAKDAYDKNKVEQKKELQDKKDAADKRASEAAKKDESLLDKLTKPVKDAAKQQAHTDITKWAIIGIGLWLLLKRR